MGPFALIDLRRVRFTVFRVSMKINAINLLEITCSVFHSVAISTKLLEINYSDLHILKMVQKLRYRRGLYQNVRVFLFRGTINPEHS